MKTTKPVHPERFNLAVKRIRTSQLLHIPPMAAFQCQLLLTAYHGSTWKVGTHFIRYAIRAKYNSTKTRFLMWIGDKMGWTKLYPMTDTSGFVWMHERHGCHCLDHRSCLSETCIEDGWPKFLRPLVSIGGKEIKDQRAYIPADEPKLEP